MLKIKWKWNLGMYLPRLYKPGIKANTLSSNPVVCLIFLIHTPGWHHFKDMTPVGVGGVGTKPQSRQIFHILVSGIMTLQCLTE